MPGWRWERWCGAVGAPFFWWSVILVAVGVAAPWLGFLAVFPLGALVLYEHAYVQAGQSVPLA
jgi:hypothetical protein